MLRWSQHLSAIHVVFISIATHGRRKHKPFSDARRWIQLLHKAIPAPPALRERHHDLQAETGLQWMPRGAASGLLSPRACICAWMLNIEWKAYP